MKALVYQGKSDIRYEDFADPELKDDGGVIVQAKLCGICGSDLHLYHGMSGETGFCVGHEAVGEVVEVGRAVKRLKIGDQVMIAASAGCGRCGACTRGDVIRCEFGAASAYGQGKRLQGCQAEAIWAPGADFNVRKIPDGVTHDQALMLTDNLPTAWFGCVQADIRPGDDVAVVGLGPIGLMAVECAQVLGAGRVFAVDLVDERRRMAAELGAIALHPDTAPQEIDAATSGRKCRSVVEAVGLDATVELALRLVGQEGTVSAVGVNFNQAFAFPMLMSFLKNTTFRIGGCPVQRYWDELGRLIQSGRLRPERFITHRLPLSEGAEAYRIFDQRQAGALKSVLTP